MDFAALLTTEGLLALLTLTAMETVLGIDNVVFISVLCDRLPEARRAAARRLGLIAAMAMRVVLLFTIGWLTGLTEPLFALDLAIVQFEPSVRDLIMLIGGLVLMAKAVMEMHELVEGDHHDDHSSQGKTASFGSVLLQVMLMDLVFSLDSVITAVGGRRALSHGGGGVDPVGIMLALAEGISTFVSKNPLKEACFSVLVAYWSHADGGRVHFHIEEGTSTSRGLLDFCGADQSAGSEARASNEPLASTWSASNVRPFLGEHFRQRA